MSKYSGLRRTVDVCIQNTASGGFNPNCDKKPDPLPPTYPIHINWPTPNSVFTSENVTFHGTAEPSTVITALGEQIQVSAQGAWTWVHQFNAGIHRVVFTGPQNQKASVNFSVAAHLVEIDPIGVMLEGYQYVFTESVTITGIGKPNSNIQLNGNTVQVDASGVWTFTGNFTDSELHAIMATSPYGSDSSAFYSWFDGAALTTDTEFIDAGGFLLEVQI